MTMYILCDKCKREVNTIDAVVYKNEQLCKKCKEIWEDDEKD